MKPLSIRSISVKGFMAHKERTINLPRTGPFVVTGETGSGKSSLLLDSVYWAFWGKVPRGDPSDDPANADGSVCAVRVVTDDLYVMRSKEGVRKRHLEWQRRGGVLEEWGSVPKAEAALIEEVGPRDRWYWTHVFSSLDLSFFAGSGDAERKVFLEQMLGVDVYSQAHRSAKNDLDLTQREVHELSLELAALEAKIQVLEESTEPPPPPEAPRPEKSDEEEAAAALRQVVDGRRELLRQIAGKEGGLKARVRQLKQWLDEMAGGSCPTCGQSIAQDLIEKTQEDHRGTKARLDDLQARVEKKIKEGEGAERAARQTLDEVRQLRAAWRTYDEAASAVGKSAARAEGLRQKLTELRHTLADRRDHEAVCRDGVFALSPQGVRAWAVAEALEAVTDLANDWLQILSPKIRVEFKGDSDLKKGGTTDKISMNVIAAGGGSFKMVSQGERQIVALAVRLAIASLRNDRGTLIFDEAVGAISVGNIGRVVRFIQELSADRCVVFITHDDRLVRALGGSSYSM